MVVAAVAVLNYAVVTGAQPSLVSSGPLAPERAKHWRNDPREVTIHDARQAATPPTLDDAGFLLVRHPYAAERLDPSGSHDPKRSPDPGVRRICFAQAEAITRAATGAASVAAFDWTCRTREPHAPDSTAVGAPVLRVHNDFTPRSARETIRQVLPVSTGACSGAPADKVQRYAIVSVWRAMRPVSAWPLALADARSVGEADLIPVQRRYPHARGETGFVAYRPAHRWFTFPLMRPDEALLFKLFDSSSDVARWTPHSAFRGPAASVSAPARESVEVRVLVVY